MDRPFVGFDPKYAKNYDKIFRKTPKERFIRLVHAWLLRLIIGRKI